MRKAALNTVLILLIVVPAGAQTNESRGTVSGVVGAGQTWDDEGSLGRGVGVGAAVEWRLFGNTRVELAGGLLTHDHDSGFFKASGRTALVTGAVVQRFGRATVQPYVLLGVALARHTGEVTFSDGLPRRRRSLDAGGVIGGGLAIRINERLEVGPDVRLFSLVPENSIDPASAYMIGLRVGYRF